MNRQPEYQILAALLDAAPACVSGESLASKLRVTRVAVFHHIEKLRAAGHPVEAVRAGGYRVTREPAQLTPLLLQYHLAARKVAPERLTLLDTIDSTNDEASRQLAAGRDAPFVILARNQTKGRGRFGRAWHSETPRNLYASFAFRPRIAAPRMQTFTLWMGAVLADFLTRETAAPIALKWPNDLLCSGKKLAGMLTEARMDSDQIRDLVFGLGLNINPPAKGWPDELKTRATSLNENLPRPVASHALAAALVARVFDAYDQFIADRHRDDFADLWNRHDCLRNQTVTILSGNEEHAGVVLGVDDAGSLLLRDASGKTQAYRAGEVTLKKAG
jgi:BirA family biotin operon repressor/biotin-[acetyl-CoA-carboxylase] ligase